MDEKMERGAVEIVAPDEQTVKRLEAIATVARACEQLAIALGSPVLSVVINGSITANARYGVKTKKR